MPDGVICTHHVWIVWRSAEKADGDGSMTQPSAHKEMLYTLQGVLQRPSPLEPAAYDDGSTLVVDRDSYRIVLGKRTMSIVDMERGGRILAGATRVCH